MGDVVKHTRGTIKWADIKFACREPQYNSQGMELRLSDGFDCSMTEWELVWRTGNSPVVVLKSVAMRKDGSVFIRDREIAWETRLYDLRKIIVDIDGKEVDVVDYGRFFVPSGQPVVCAKCKSELPKDGE